MELHVYPRGPHGMSLAISEPDAPGSEPLADPHVAKWFDACLEWLDYAGAP